MNTLITGGNGFIGTHLVDHLLLNGHTVRVFDSVNERFRKPNPNVDYRISTLDNIPDLYEAMLGIDIIFHLASSSVPSTSNIDTISDINKNLVPSLNLLNLAVKLEIERIIYFSSGGAVYGNPVSSPVKEDHLLQPISSYGIVKSTVERYLFLYQQLYNIRPLILRPSNPYGPRQGHYMAQGVISTFLRKIKHNESLTVFGDGTGSKDYIYIDDLIDQCYRLSVSKEVGIFNIGSGTSTSINQIINQITKTTNITPKIINADLQNFDVSHFILDITKTSKILGKINATSLETGISTTWEWIKKFG
jgi:UDP-glucose 4-epimerase